jgi:hypothetical protein
MKRKIGSWLQAASSAGRTPRDLFLDQALLAPERDRILAQIAETMPLNPVLQGRKVYSQCDEDGIIGEIFRRIGPTSRTFIEFGAGDGRENNSHCLLLRGWRGLWAEGDPRNIARITGSLAQSSRSPELLLFAGFVTLDNVVSIDAEARAEFLIGDDARIDLLSMDLDGNDLHFLERLLPARPRVICAEYNAQLGPELELSVAYREDHHWDGDDYMGATLGALRALLEPAGYALVCCNLSGANAFFVEREHAHLFGGYSPDQLFQPARYHMIFLDQFHPRSLRFLADRCRYSMVQPASAEQP